MEIKADKYDEWKARAEAAESRLEEAKAVLVTARRRFELLSAAIPENVNGVSARAGAEEIDAFLGGSDAR